MRRAMALLLLAALVAGCAGPPASPAPDQAPGDDDAPRMGRSSRGAGGADAQDNRTVASLGSASGGPLGPGTYPFTVTVPAGGAEEVAWVLEVVPAAAFLLDGVRGPGCETWGWYTSGTSSGTQGTCDDLPPGPHEVSFVLNAPVASFRVGVHGSVWEPEPAPGTPTNRTEP
jgi:hypothetical protein